MSSNRKTEKCPHCGMTVEAYRSSRRNHYATQRCTVAKELQDFKAAGLVRVHGYDEDTLEELNIPFKRHTVKWGDRSALFVSYWEARLLRWVWSGPEEQHVWTRRMLLRCQEDAALRDATMTAEELGGFNAIAAMWRDNDDADRPQEEA